MSNSSQGWLKLSIDVDPSQVEAWSEHFMEVCGALSVDIGDAFDGLPEEVPLFGEPGEEHIHFWHTNRVSALFEPQAERDWIEWLRIQANQLNFPVPHCTCATIDDQDWVTLTQAQFQPIQISSRLWILPSWHEPVSPDSLNLVVDPGMAFGTGTHPTTRLCLKWMETHLKSGCTVLDYGCGSGILAIAAAKLGAAQVSAVDIDPVACEVSTQNAMINNVEIQTFSPQKLPSEKVFDYVIANILANPLRVLAPILCKHAGNHGILLLSGLWREQADDIAAHYLDYGYKLKLEQSDEGWALLIGHHLSLQNAHYA